MAFDNQVLPRIPLGPDGQPMTMIADPTPRPELRYMIQDPAASVLPPAQRRQYVPLYEEMIADPNAQEPVLRPGERRQAPPLVEDRIADPTF